MNNNIINENNCVEHYKLDVKLCKNQLKKYEKETLTYSILLEAFVIMLQEKYQEFMNDCIEGMPECDLDIYKEF